MPYIERIILNDESRDIYDVSAVHKGDGIEYSTMEPIEDNYDGIKIIVLNYEPSEKKSGYLYVIKKTS